MKATERKGWDADRIVRTAIGVAVMAAGVLYLFFGERHCDAARFIAFAVCTGAGMAIKGE